MKTFKLLNMAPMLIMVGFLAYAAYSIQPATPNTVATTPKAAPSPKTADKSAPNPSPSGPKPDPPTSTVVVRDPFKRAVAEPQTGTAGGPGGKPGETRPDTPQPDPHIQVVQGLVLNATFLQGQTQMAVINGRIYQKGQHLEGPNAELSPLLVARVLPTEVVLQANSKRYVLAYPDKFGTPGGDGSSRRTSSYRDEVLPGPDAQDLSSQLALIRTLLDSPLAALGSLRTSSAGRSSASSRRSVSQPPNR